MPLVRLSRALADQAQTPREFVVTSDRPLLLQAVLADLARQAPAAGRRVRDETGAVRQHVNVYVGDDEHRRLAGLDTPVPPDEVVSVIGAVSGG